jgi:hypothetical protein
MTAAALSLILAAHAGAASIKIVAFNEKSAPYDTPGLVKLLARADEKSPDPDKIPLWAATINGRIPPQRMKLSQKDGHLLASWEGTSPVRLELIWPVLEDGYNAVVADNGGAGYVDGETVYLAEEITKTQYNRFKESWKWRSMDWQPLYKPGKKSRELFDAAKEAMAAAAREKDPPTRGKMHERALHAISLAWANALIEHGVQRAVNDRRASEHRFGLTLDEDMLKRLDDLDWVVDAVSRSGANWVRVVFRANSSDFTYASLRSFNEYDGIIDRLARKKILVMGCVLDTAQWPKSLTAALYAERVKNLVLHYRGKVASWEVGSEINGDWLGGAGAPLSLDEVYRIYTAGVDKVKELDPELETVATLYAWEETAPDRAHSLSGWLTTQVKRGFGKNLDVLGLSVQPEDNPAGMGFERMVTAARDTLPGQKLMISSLGFAEKDQIKGYWWVAPGDVENARKDVAVLYTTVSCAMPRSLCGVFWWQTLDQMLPSGNRKGTELYKMWKRALTQLGHRG